MLRKDVIIVNEYTVKNKSGKGSRGSTPGNYVMQYMARGDATEKSINTEQGYMTRVSATEQLPDEDWKDKLSGVAFCEDDISMPKRKVKRKSKEIQKAYDEGKTIMKTVISFSEEYLKQNNIVPKDLEIKKKGDYRGNFDQLKLRYAITNGMQKLSSEYDDLRWVATLQVDTKHIHCHLAMYDAGKGNVMPDGTQKGKITGLGRQKIRRGVDMFLDDTKSIPYLASNVSKQRRNSLTYTKALTHKAMIEQGNAQLMLAMLPDDPKLWKAGSKDKRMKRANLFTKMYVNEVLSQKDSNYNKAVRDIMRYAAYRKTREGLSKEEYDKLIINGKERIVHDCMNGVYSVLKQVKQTDKQVSTKYLDTVGLTDEELKNLTHSEDRSDLLEFSYRTRSYMNRLDKHKAKKKQYDKYIDYYEKAENASEDSYPLYQHFKVERDYHLRLLSKYQYFLRFLPYDRKGMISELAQISDMKEKVDKLKEMINDGTIVKMKPVNAEEYGVKVYDTQGGHYMKDHPEILDYRLKMSKKRYYDKKKTFQQELENEGFRFDGKGIKRRSTYSFDDVKMLDLHELSYDFSHDFEISKSNVDEFVAFSDKRVEAYEEAKDYLIGSGQEEMIDLLDEDDIYKMQTYAKRIEIKSIFEAPEENKEVEKRKFTTLLGSDYEKEIREMVKQIVETTTLY